MYTNYIQVDAEGTEDSVAEDRVPDLQDSIEDDGDGGEQGASPVDSESEEESDPGSTYNQTKIR